MSKSVGSGHRRIHFLVIYMRLRRRWICAGLSIFLLAATPAAADDFTLPDDDLVSARQSSCSPAILAKRLEEVPPEKPQVTFDVAERRSTDDGEWLLWMVEGKLRTAVRNDYGETGRWSARYDFLTRNDFAIETRSERYMFPYYASQGIVVQRVVVERYFICGGKVVEGEVEDNAGDVRELMKDLDLEPELKTYLGALPAAGE